ncbi:MAG: polymer-forming cytoskeletal protein [Flavobacteriales bacterium]|nr:polymer-forming cytoskeletal protein [Flavobacteriales bacterium]
MFKGKENRPADVPGAINTIVAGTLIEGNMVLDGNIRFEGRLKGNIESKGKVVIGNSGFIEGDIICQDADIAGQVKGNIFSKELTRLSAGSEVTGDIKTGKLAIEPGAIFTGACMMNGNTQNKNTLVADTKLKTAVSAG